MDEAKVSRVRKDAKAKRKSWKERNPDWAQSSSIERAFNGLKDATITKYKTALPWFFAFVDKTPDEIFNERKAQLKKDDLEVKYFYEDTMKRYKDFLISLHYESGSVVEKMNRVAGFFSRNRLDLDLPKTFWDVETTDYVKQKSTTKRFPEQNEARAIFEVTDLKGKVSTLLGYQCGLATGDVAKISWNNLNIDFGKENREFIHVVQAREKTNVKHLIVLGPDLLYNLKQLWMRQDKPKSGYLFKGYGENKKIITRMINDWFKEAAEKALGKERADEISFKDLRDSYNEVLLAHNVTAEVKDVLFGHKRKGAKSSYSINIMSVVAIYEKVYPDLTVNGVYNTKNEDIKDIEKQLRTQDEMIKTLIDRNQALEDKVTGLQGFWDMVLRHADWKPKFDASDSIEVVNPKTGEATFQKREAATP